MICGSSIKSGADLFKPICRPVENERGLRHCRDCREAWLEVKPGCWRRVRVAEARLPNEQEEPQTKKHLGP
jgi:hypothetical protein